MKNKGEFDSIEIFDNEKKLYYTFLLWLDKFGLIHYFNDCICIIDFYNTTSYISDFGQIPILKPKGF